jgi:hypothetical protein
MCIYIYKMIEIILPISDILKKYYNFVESDDPIIPPNLDLFFDIEKHVITDGKNIIKKNEFYTNKINEKNLQYITIEDTKISSINTSFYTGDLLKNMCIQPRISKIINEIKRIKRIKEILIGLDDSQKSYKDKHYQNNIATFIKYGSYTVITDSIRDSIRDLQHYDEKDKTKQNTKIVFNRVIEYMALYILYLYTSVEIITKQGYFSENKNVMFSNTAENVFVEYENKNSNNKYEHYWRIRNNCINDSFFVKNNKIFACDTYILAYAHKKWNIFWDGDKILTKEDINIMNETQESLDKFYKEDINIMNETQESLDKFYKDSKEEIKYLE